MKLSEKQIVFEFECKDGSDMPVSVYNNVLELAKNLQVIRDEVSKPIKLTNAYRSLEHNRMIGSKDTSQHVKGNAADIKVKGVEPKDVYNIISNLIDKGAIKQGGLGLYNTFVHYDIRGYKARW